MCHESEKQMSELFKGEEPTLENKGLIMLAQNQDKNFNSVDKRFENVETKLDKIIGLIEANKKATDERIEILKKDNANNCVEHKKQLKAEVEKLRVETDKLKIDTEDLNYFKRNPKVLQLIVAAIVFAVAYAIGKGEFIKLIL